MRAKIKPYFHIRQKFCGENPLKNYEICQKTGRFAAVGMILPSRRAKSGAAAGLLALLVFNFEDGVAVFARRVVFFAVFIRKVAVRPAVFG